MPVEVRDTSGGALLMVTFGEFVHFSVLRQIRGISEVTSQSCHYLFSAFNVYHHHHHHHNNQSPRLRALTTRLSEYPISREFLRSKAMQ